MMVNEWASWFKMLFVRNGWWKLFSLALAIFIYFSIRSEISHVRILTFPLEVEYDEGAPDSLGQSVVESIEPAAVQVMVRGSYSEVTRLDEKTVRCLIRPRQKGNLQDIETIKIKNSNLRGIGGVRVVRIEPSQISVKFDVPMSLTLPVAPPVVEGRARGRVELEYEHGSQPPTAVVKGSRRLLSPLDVTKVRIQSAPISVEGRTQTFTARVKLNPPGGVLNAKIDPPEIMVTVKVINEQTSAKLEHIPVNVMGTTGLSSFWKAEPAWVDVELVGRAEVLSAIRSEDLLVSVNGNIPVVSGSSSSEVPVFVHLRPGVLVDDAKPIPSKVKLIAIAEPAPLIPIPEIPSEKATNGVGVSVSKWESPAAAPAGSNRQERVQAPDEAGAGEGKEAGRGGCPLKSEK